MVEISSPKGIEELYASLMAEAKARLRASTDRARHASAIRESDNVAASLEAEFCYLQLRRVTELVAIGVLAAHNPIPEFRAKDLVKSWNASDLLKQLAKLSDEAFPQRADFYQLPDRTDGAGYLLVKPKQVEARNLICGIYDECGDKLHTGTLKLVVKQRTKTYSLTFIRESTNKLCELLDTHIVMLPDKSVIEAKLNLRSLGPVFCRWLHTEPQPSA